MADKNISVLNQSGQSMVEYVLLLLVVATLSTSLLNSNLVRNLLSEQGVLGRSIKGKLEYSYRNGGAGAEGSPPIPSYTNKNAIESYYNRRAGETRFFAPAEPYPQ